MSMTCGFMDSTKRVRRLNRGDVVGRGLDAITLAQRVKPIFCSGIGGGNATRLQNLLMQQAP